MDINKILIVDDDADIRKTLSVILNKKFYTDEAATGEEALEKIKQDDFNLVFLDIVLPGLDGIETLRMMKLMKPDIDIILMTGYSIEEDVIEGVRMGAFGYIYKPFTKSEILKVIGNVAKKKEVKLETKPNQKEALQTPPSTYVQRRKFQVAPIAPTKYRFQLKYAITIAGAMILLLAISQLYTYKTLQSILPHILSAEIGGRINSLQTYLLIFGIAYSIVIAWLSIYVTHKMAGPVYRMETDAKRLSKEPDLSFRFKLRSSDEFQEVADSLNRMMESLEKKYGNGK